MPADIWGVIIQKLDEISMVQFDDFLQLDSNTTVNLTFLRMASKSLLRICQNYLNKIPLNRGSIIKSSEVFRYFAANGLLSCMKDLHESGYEWDLWTCTASAANGHLECLKYAHENNCPWDIRTTSYATEGGHFSCLKYAYENGCKWISPR